MRALLLVLALVACDAGARDGGAKARPEPAITGTKCASLVPRMRAAFVAYDAHAGFLADHIMPVLLAACIDDKWPESLKACVATAAPGVLHACDALVPRDVADKLVARLRPMLPPGTELDLPATFTDDSPSRR